MKKVFMFFVVCFLFINISNAEFSSTPLTSGTKFSYSASISASCSYSRSQIYSIASDYYNGNNIDIFEIMVETLKSEGFFTVVFYGNSQVCVLLVPDTNVSVGRFPSDGQFYLTAIDSSISCPRTYMYNKSNSTWYCDVTGSKCHNLAFSIGVQSSKYFSNINIKSLSYSGGFCWNGTDYFYQASSPGPVIPGGLITAEDINLPSIITALKDSLEIDNIPYYFRNKYFIVPFGNDYYEIYFYHNDTSLNAFEYLGSDEVLYYDMNKISDDDNTWLRIKEFFLGTALYEAKSTYHVMTAYIDDNDTTNIVYSGSFDIDNLVGFVSETNPIIYTTHEIPYYYFEQDEESEEWIATAYSDNNVVVPVVLDSEGTEITTTIPSTISPISDMPWDRFINAINTLPQAIGNYFQRLFIPDMTKPTVVFNEIVGKFNFITQSKNIIDNIISRIVLNPTDPPSVIINLSSADSQYNWGTSAVCLDLSWYVPFKPFVDIFICAFIYGYFFWSLFRKLSDIINGTSGFADFTLSGFKGGSDSYMVNRHTGEARIFRKGK